MMDEMIKRGKRKRLAVAILDIRKAFDSVPHEAIRRSLIAHGVDEALVKIVNNMYSEGRTVFKNCGGFELEIKRSVKQGDPLSPLLFNLVLNPLLVKLEESGEGFRVGGNAIPVLAFADDLVLASVDPLGLQNLLDIVVEYLQDIGLSLSYGKCGVFGVREHYKSWITEDLAIRAGGEQIRNYNLIEDVRYLGAYFSLDRGLCNERNYEGIVGAAERVKRLPLKPRQKLDLLTKYVLPGYYHLLVANPPSHNRIVDLDLSIRNIVKDFMHLPSGITNSLLYCRRVDRGLGIPR